MFGGGWYTKGR